MHRIQGIIITHNHRRQQTSLFKNTSRTFLQRQRHQYQQHGCLSTTVLSSSSFVVGRRGGQLGDSNSSSNIHSDTVMNSSRPQRQRLRFSSSSLSSVSLGGTEKRWWMRHNNSNNNNNSTLSVSRSFASAVMDYDYYDEDDHGRVGSIDDGDDDERESMPVDVLIVGGGPAGLSAAIRLKQLCIENDKDLSITVIDKGSEIGSHILSGNVFDPIAMHELFPEHAIDNGDPNHPEHWTKHVQDVQGSIPTPVQNDQFKVLFEGGMSFDIPNILLPSQLHNDGNYIISLSQLCRWLATKAEELGVEVYPGFAASKVLIDHDYDQDSEKSNPMGAVKGVAVRDVGIAKDGSKKSTYEKGMALYARQTLFCEGARGPCTLWLEKHFQLRSNNNNNTNNIAEEGSEDINFNNNIQPQTYGLGIKEVWQIPKEKLQPGLVQHTLGYPLQMKWNEQVFGGSFLYHQEPDLILCGLVIGLDYQNPYINPYQEFQRWKKHPAIQKQLEGGTPISYGARVLNEGGYHSIPKITFPGGALVGCSAGFLNAVKIKGSHTAMKSGIVAAESCFQELYDLPSVAETGELTNEDGSKIDPIEITSYTKGIKNSWIHDELYQVRNTHEAFSRWGVTGGLIYTGLATHISKGKEPWTLQHTKLDSDKTDVAKKFKPIQYPTPDNVITFDLLTNLQRSNTYHEEDQPSHLRIKTNKKHIPISVSYQEYAAPESRFCPAGVYEYVDDEDGFVDNVDLDDDNNGNENNENNNNNDNQVNGAAGAAGEGGGCNNNNNKKKKLVINAQNCLHCFTCSAKTPEEYIQWTVPEGGGGPQYQNM